MKNKQAVPAMVQQVKDLALPHQQYRLQLWLWFHPWSGNVSMQWVWLEKKKKKNDQNKNENQTLTLKKKGKIPCPLIKVRGKSPEENSRAASPRSRRTPACRCSRTTDMVWILHKPPGLMWLWTKHVNLSKPQVRICKRRMCPVRVALRSQRHMAGLLPWVSIETPSVRCEWEQSGCWVKWQDGLRGLPASDSTVSCQGEPLVPEGTSWGE